MLQSLSRTLWLKVITVLAHLILHTLLGARIYDLPDMFDMLGIKYPLKDGCLRFDVGWNMTVLVFRSFSFYAEFSLLLILFFTLVWYRCFWYLLSVIVFLFLLSLTTSVSFDMELGLESRLPMTFESYEICHFFLLLLKRVSMPIKLHFDRFSNNFHQFFIPIFSVIDNLEFFLACYFLLISGLGLSFWFGLLQTLEEFSWLQE